MTDKIMVRESKVVNTNTEFTREQVVHTISAIEKEQANSEELLDNIKARLDFQKKLLAEMDKGSETLEI